MKVRTLTALCLMAHATTPLLAQEQDSLKFSNHFFYQELNYLDNMYAHTSNPVYLSKNKVKTVADAHLVSFFSKGDFHAIDQGKKARELEINISGLKNFGRLDVYGHIDYVNGKEYDHRWNNTLLVTETNPFILADSICSDANTEIFKMSVAAAYRWNDRFTGALSLSYKTGSFSDQTDPRPKTDAMHFEINPGAEIKLGTSHALGISAHVDIFRSDLSHTIVNNYANYTYFIMNGMGDYKINTSNDLGAYPRDYKGLLYGASLQWLYARSHSKVSNLLQLAYHTNKEVSEDGGYAFTFKSGDYYRNDISLYNRLRICNSDNFRQNISIMAQYATDHGDWYDQKKVIDPDHGNIAQYQILNKSKIMESTRLDAQLTYQADFLRRQLPHLTLTGSVSFRRADMKHFSNQVYHQNYNLLGACLGARQHFSIRQWRMSASVQAFYQRPMGDAQYACAEPKLNDAYVAPQFEYDSATRLGFNAGAEASLPVHLYGYTTWMGLKLYVSTAWYQGDNKYSHVFDATSRTAVHAAYNIRF